MKDSLQKVLLQIARVLPGSAAGLEEEVEGLDTARRFSPRLYFDYFMLLQDMAQSDVRAVAARCAALRRCLHMPYADRFEVRERMDEIALSFMRAHRAATLSDASHLSIDAPESATYLEYADSIPRCTAASARRHLATLQMALAASEPHLADEISSLVSVVQLMPQSFSAEAASSLSAFGTVLVRPPMDTPETSTHFFYFDRIVHESAHIYLNMLMTFDPLLTNGAALAASPARQTLRPLKGVLHAHFVFFRLLHAYRHAPDAIRRTEASCPPRAEMDRMSLSALPLSFAAREAVYLDKFIQGDAILRSSAAFTPCGQRLFDAMTETLCHV
ncbi:aKG-HExxH-type peptide beta-hydroxylase [Caballeronia sp. LZ035]|uniref:aKG-HExxH-type peptide beta-hydroxylase n=1 Tax=Caballeronia sp. LZ035 TaxID=3038568 RepID=UPI0028606FA1|nr:HEXXH motif-containing putative peptide modification protein [Caballeronia sp. LZ035]MDR5759737.1 HEXXH motif-containing putative peptide modification protein [Caballeronia sp. LZ035]